MNHKKILSLLLCFLFLLTNNLAYSSENNQKGFPSWFHVNANIFKINHVLPLNMSSDTSITMDVVVPEDNIFQKIIAVSSEPDPNSTFTDGNGLRRLRYELTTTVPRFLNITIHYAAMILFSSLTSDFSGTQDQEDIPTEIREKYIKPAPYIESDDNSLIDNATMISGNATSIHSKITRLFNFVSNRTLFEYDESVQEIQRDHSSHVRGALWALKNHKGVCFDFAHLFVALLRAECIPSRVSEGIILDGRSGFIVHDWAEVYLSGFGWIPFDPTWKEAGCNIHMKILNPSYDEYMRWNYSIHNGRLYEYPKNSTYAVNDQIYIENTTYPSIVDSFTTINSYFNLTRILEFDNETVSSCLYIPRGSQTLNIFYGRLQVNFSKRILGVEVIVYSSDFRFHHPKRMQIRVSIPWNLIFSDSVIPSLGSVTYSYASGELHFTLVDPVLWVGVILTLVGLVAFVMLLRKRRNSSKKCFPIFSRFPVPTVYNGAYSSACTSIS